MRLLSRLRVICCSCVTLGSVAYAQVPTATIGVRANVPSACSASTQDYGVLDFGSHGALDSLIYVTSTEGAGTIQVTCVEGLSFSIELDGGLHPDGEQRYMRSSANGLVRYQLFSDPQFTQLLAPGTQVTLVGTGLVQQLPLYGRVPSQQTPPVGVYRDTISVTVAW